MVLKNKKLESRLAKYSAIAAGVVVAGNAQSQVVYTDINPDTMVNQIDSFMLDLNNDGTPDFKIKADLINRSYSSYGSIYRINADFVYASAENSLNEILVSYISSTSYSYSSFFPAALNKNDKVKISPSSGQAWYSVTSYSSGVLNARVDFYMKNSYSSYSTQDTIGNFKGVKDKYLGLKFNINGKDHLGWVCLDVAADGKSFVVKDYAYEKTPNTEIVTGDKGVPLVEADIVSDLVASDVGDNSDASDLEVKFTKAVDETTILEYRVMVVKADKVSGFDLSSAKGLASNKYTTLNKTGSNFSLTLLSGHLDTDGDAITIGKQYQVFVMSVADGTNANENSLYTEQNAKVTLNTKNEAVTNLSISDNGDNNDASDIKITFDKLNDETTVSNYKVFVIKASKSASFDEAAAESNANFFDITPNGTNISTSLSSALKDTDGDAVTEGVKYKAKVLSVADGSNANLNSLSVESNELMLVNTNSIVEEKTKTVNAFVSENLLRVEQIDNNYNFLNIYSISGELVYSKKDIKNVVEVEISEYATGIYVLKLNGESKTYTQKFLID